MTKKYEKFEEWMVGKEVEASNGDVGVVIGVYQYSDAAVWADWGNFEGNLWIAVEDLKFIEEAPIKEEDVSIPWEVGQVVWDVIYGKGVVTRITNNANPVRIEFDSGEVINVYPDGSHYYGVRTVFFSEPTIIADTMPPKKSFAPKLKFDDGFMVINSHGKVECYGYVEQEFEDSVAMRTGEVYEKAYYSFFKLGEEIKWEN